MSYQDVCDCVKMISRTEIAVGRLYSQEAGMEILMLYVN